MIGSENKEMNKKVSRYATVREIKQQFIDDERLSVLTTANKSDPQIKLYCNELELCNERQSLNNLNIKSDCKFSLNSPSIPWTKLVEGLNI